jgi:ATP-dependent DNA helicase DinG
MSPTSYQLLHPAIVYRINIPTIRPPVKELILPPVDIIRYLESRMNLPQEITSLFSESGSISSSFGFEYRPQQLSMATEIIQALESKHHLVIEAPTGVGKSIAYLVPAILYALSTDRKAIISTYTKNLQEQLIRKDIPLVKKLIGKDFTAVVLKGRKNYLCSTRLKHALAQQKSLFDKKVLHELGDLEAWAETTPDGDMENLPFSPSPELWQQVCAEQGICTPKNCRSDCFYQTAKEKTRSANLVVVNHALFFSLFGLQGTDEYFLYKDDFVIFDEAHMLEQVAGLGSGKNISRSQVLFAIRSLFNPKTKKGLLSKKRDSESADACTEAQTAAVAFFDDVKRWSESAGERSGSVRIRNPYFVLDSLATPLERLETAVKRFEEREKINAQKEELAAARRRLWEARVLVGEFISQHDPSMTFWVEQGRGKNPNIVLCAAPTNIAEVVGPKLFGSDSTVILTSATLSVQRSLEYFKNRIGAYDARAIMLDTPFDFQRQMRLVLVRDIPSPDQPAYEQDLPRWIINSVERSKGKALVLFTSALMLKKMKEATQKEIEERGYTLLFQDQSTPRHVLLDRFKNDIHSVLYGLDSFWMGIDVPGEALEHVIITRLPFSVPDHPLIESRLDLIKQSGGNPFEEFTLPEAVLKFRQGVGRLIRNSTDKGIITILDSRICTKYYGKVFLNSLPRCPVEVVRENGDIEEVDMS